MKKSLNLFTLLMFLLFAAGSCSDKTTPEPENTDHAAMGDWSGTFEGGDNGTWQMTVDSEGAFSGSFFSTNSQSSNSIDSGFVDDNGAMSAVINVNGVILDFSGQVTGNSASGTWGNPSINITGTWTGSKQ